MLLKFVIKKVLLQKLGFTVVKRTNNKIKSRLKPRFQLGANNTAQSFDG